MIPKERYSAVIAVSFDVDVEAVIREYPADRRPDIRETVGSREARAAALRVELESAVLRALVMDAEPPLVSGIRVTVTGNFLPRAEA